MDALLAQYVRGSTVRLDVITPYNPSSRQATALVPVIRAVPAGDGITTEVGGGAALAADFLQGEARLLPFAVGWTMLATMVILFLLFGSIAIPIKAVIMTLLSVTASFGALVWIFQEGHLEGLLNFQSLGYTIAGLPIIMFCIIFGLSMDYEVLLLSRIQEAYRRTGDNTTAVAEGLVRTARVITGAALIMVSVFVAFALADSVAIKSVGVGMAIAVLIDATIVRVLLVPATMRLLGRWNWWAPGPLKHLADRIGFDHIEDLPDEEAGGPGAGPGRRERRPVPESASGSGGGPGSAADREPTSGSSAARSWTPRTRGPAVALRGPSRGRGGPRLRHDPRPGGRPVRRIRPRRGALLRDAASARRLGLWLGAGSSPSASTSSSPPRPGGRRCRVGGGRGRRRAPARVRRIPPRRLGRVRRRGRARGGLAGLGQAAGFLPGGGWTTLAIGIAFLVLAAYRARRGRGPRRSPSWARSWRSSAASRRRAR